MSATGPQIWFYHLERSGLQQVLPTLLDKVLQADLRAQVRVSDPDLAARLADGLWTWRDDSFLANGHSSGPHPERQPILFTSGTDNLNGAQALFIVDGAGFEPTEDFQRCFILFDGQDEEALKAARERWKAFKAVGADISYWRQTLDGRWEKAG